LRTEPIGLVGVLADDFYALSRSDVVAGNPVVLGLDVEAFSEFGGSGKSESSTHGETV
jgi:hypothetical protein